MREEDLIFNRVFGLKFLYEFFPEFFDEGRIKMYFFSSKEELKAFNIENENFDTILLKRSGSLKYGFYSDLKCKDNRFFNSLKELKNGINEFEDTFDYCVECHKFRPGENYYSDRLAIAQFSTKNDDDNFIRVNFIPSKKDGVNTRDNIANFEINYPYGYGNIFYVNKFDDKNIRDDGYSNYKISVLANDIFLMIDKIREVLIEFGCKNSFQLIIRIDKNLNLLPIDLRTPEAWLKLH